MKKHLTSANVLTLPTKRAAYHCWDTGSDSAKGLAVLVSPNGVRTYRAVYYYPGSAKPHAFKLGRVGEMSLDDAREKTREVRGLARKGLDPKAGDPARSGDFKSAINVWTQKEQLGRKQARSAHSTEGFVLSATRAWHARPIASIRDTEIEELLHVKREVAPYSANRLHAHLATFFKWALRTKRIAVNPMAVMPRPWEGGKPRAYDWFKGEAADKVVRELWLLAGELGGDDEMYIKLMVITGKRKNAVLKMAWEQIVNNFWAPIPGSKTKRNHAIPLPKLAMRILGKPKKTGQVMYVREGKLKMLVRQRLKLDSFIWHGVRHIVETKLAELRVPYHIRDLLLDHAPMRGAGRGYDHYVPREEMLEALERWCAHILKVTGRPRRSSN